MERFFDTVQNRNGKAVAGATITVYSANGGLASIYSDNGVTLKANPTTTNLDGEYWFYAADGVYTVDISGPGINPETRPGITLFDPSSPGASNSVQFAPSGAGVVVRTTQNKLRDTVSIKDYGAVGDGITDDSAAIVAAAASGRTVYFPSGTYRCTTFSIPLANGAYFLGDGAGKSTIRFVSSTTTSKVDFITTAGNITFDRLTIYHDGPVNETAQIITLESTGITVTDCEIKSNDSVSYDTVVNAFQFTNNNASDITVSGCNIHNLNRVILRSNTTTGVVNRVLFVGNRIHNLGQGGVQFNFPLGSISGVRIIGNHFYDFYAGTERIFCGGASVNNMTITGNVFSGSGYECIHIEEAGNNVTISGNVFNIDGDGIFITDNNISGTYYQPNAIAITGNIFQNPGTPGTHSGIRAPEDGSGIEGYSYLTVSNNVFRGYEFGAELGYGEAVVEGNTFANCTTGIKTNDAHPSIAGNFFDNCTTGVSVLLFGGMLGVNKFRNCTTVASTAASDDSRVSMTGFIILIQDDTPIAASTTTDVSLGISNGAMMYGQAKIVAYFTGTAHRQRISTLSWDGTTLTDTPLGAVGAGTVAATGFINSGGNLVFRFTNSSSQVNMRYMAVQFDGLWTSLN